MGIRVPVVVLLNQVLSGVILGTPYDVTGRKQFPRSHFL